MRASWLRALPVPDLAGTDPDAADPDAPVLDVRGLEVAYGTVPVVRGVSFRVAPGETVALVGESGSGKTTTAHAAAGLLPPAGRRTAGSVLVGGRDLAGWSERRLSGIRGRHVGLVPQDPTLGLDPTRRIGAQVADPLLVHGLADRRGAARRALNLLADAGFDDPAGVARRYPHQLSGGQRQRVLIAIALSCEPRLVIADEPTSALDVTVQKVVLDHLADRARALGTAVLLITHDLAVAAERADRVLVMHDGRVVEEGRSGDVLADPQATATRRLVAAAPSLASTRLIDGRPRPVPVDPAPLVEVEHLTVRYRTRVPGRGRVEVRAVDDLSLTVAPGRTTALVGTSGSGKTTASRAALGLVRPTSGAVRLLGHDLAGLRGEQLRDLRRQAQLVYQDPYRSLDPRWSVQQIVAAPLAAYRVGDRRSRRARAAELLDLVALPADVGARRPSQLSGGQRQRVAIARALALAPRLLVLDEPVSALDVSVQDQVLRLLVDLQVELGLGYLFVSHDLAVVRQVADEVLVLHDGALVEAGSTQQVFDRPDAPRTRELLAAIPGAGPARGSAGASGAPTPAVQTPTAPAVPAATPGG